MVEKEFYSREELLELKDKKSVQDIISDCFRLNTSHEIEVGLINEIHEILLDDYEEAVQAFWILFYINPMIAIRAYQDCILFNKIRLYIPFKYAAGSLRDMTTLNPYVENYIILGIEGMLQQKMNAEELLGDIHHYLELLYQHDKDIMAKKVRSKHIKVKQKRKWITEKNLLHILTNIDAKFIIVLLEFFTEKYKRRLHNGGDANSYSGSRYFTIISFIKNQYGSLSEHIDWDNNSLNFFYVRYFRTAMEQPVLKNDLEIVFATLDDKERIEKMI